MPPAPLITLITGANTGLGYQIVRSLLRSSTPEKAYIILAGGRSLSKAAAAVASAKAEFPDSKSSVEPIQIDIEDDTSITAVVEQIKSKYRRLDVLINNAGL
jgi:NAD(P)-dependent dehydrogenase (short-subunit alcohol dehydrogenase family)